MALLDVRKSFVALSGRYDLVKDGWKDNGADAYINAGQVYLDSHQLTAKSVSHYLKDLAAGTYKLEVSNLRILNEVWIINADGRTQLERKDLSWIKENYSKDLDDVESGTPLYYCQDISGLAPQQAELTAANYTTDFTYGHETIIFENHWKKGNILILPPPDELYTVDIIGEFYSKTLADNGVGESYADKSYWTEVHANLLVDAALMMLERSYRNTAGVVDWKNSIDLTLQGIDFDLVSQEIAGVSAMEG